MGQQEIYDFLKKNKRRWFSTRDLSDKLDTSIGSITNCIRKMREGKFIVFKKDSERKLGFLYKFRR